MDINSEKVYGNSHWVNLLSSVGAYAWSISERGSLSKHTVFDVILKAPKYVLFFKYCNDFIYENTGKHTVCVCSSFKFMNCLFLFVFRMDISSVEGKPSVQEALGIFQLIDQIETVADKLLERQVQFAYRGWGYGN
jgi:hypothetical protein